MRKTLPDILERARVTTGEFASWRDFGPYGMFELRHLAGDIMRIIAAGADYAETEGWEHVSVSCTFRTPDWGEMSYVKDLFWEPDETVFQFHPAKSLHINCHPFCLHLWRNVNMPAILPPGRLVGLRTRVRPKA